MAYKSCFSIEKLFSKTGREYYDLFRVPHLSYSTSYFSSNALVISQSLRNLQSISGSFALSIYFEV